MQRSMLTILLVLASASCASSRVADVDPLADALVLPPPRPIERGTIIAIERSEGEDLVGAFSGVEQATGAVIVAVDGASTERIPLASIERIAIEHESVTAQHVLTASLVTFALGAIPTAVQAITAEANGDSSMGPLVLIGGPTLIATTIAAVVAAVAAPESSYVVYER